MKITPLEIRKQEFKKSMRGYDPVEVETFLELVANEYDNLIAENERLNKQIITFETELKHFKEVEKTLKQTLYNVQETSQLSRANSEKEANIIRKEAELAAAQMIEKARQEMHRLKQEVVTLKQQKESFVARLRHLLSSQLELIDVLSMDDKDREKLQEGARPAERARARVQQKEKSEPQSTPVKSQAVPGENPPKSARRNETDKNFFNDIFTEQDDENDKT